MVKSLNKIALFAGALVVGVAGAAYADAGTFHKESKGVTFYWGISNGYADSHDFSGGPYYRLCQDVPGISEITNLFYSELRRNRTLQTDVVLRDISSRYNESEACTSSYNTSTSNDYHVKVTWTYADAPDDETGYARAK